SQYKGIPVKPGQTWDRLYCSMQAWVKNKESGGVAVTRENDRHNQEHGEHQMQADRSYVSGISDAPLLYKTVGEVLDDAAARFGDREALVARHQNIRWTYGELAEKAEAVAAGL